MQRVDAHSGRQRQQRDEQDDQRGDGFHEHADKQQKQVDQQDHQILVVGDRQHRPGDGLRNTLGYQDRPERIGKADQDQNGGGGNRAVHDDLRHRTQRQVTVDECPDHKGIDRGDHRRLRGRRKARQQATDDQAGHGNRPEGAKEGPAQLAKSLPGLTWEAPPLGNQPCGEHHRKAHQKARDRPGQEHLAHRDAGQGADDDHRHRGRDDRPDGRGGRRYRCREVCGIARLLHPGDHHPADRGRVRDRRSRDAAEQHGRAHIGQPQPAAHPADHRIGKPDDPLGDAAGIHQVTSQDEPRNAQQHKDIDAGVHLLWQRHERQVGIKHVSGRGDAQRHRHGQPKSEAKQEDSKQNSKIHHSSPSVLMARPSSAPVSMAKARKAANRPNSSSRSRIDPWITSIRTPRAGAVWRLPMVV